ncbi:MAG: hypothetical protein A2283_16705 [Lentisphaerae bacterium RIFOXYA12_FULL_48_11]|nr:MAG: hypothetical protein A2283_16705 [Lentisphaerae bacterium RIFOXYA12_FULL_48_11]
MKLLPSGKDEYLRILQRWGIIIGLLGFLIWFMVSMPGQTYTGRLNQLSDEEIILRDNFKSHVCMLAEKIGPRSVSSLNQLNASVNYIKEQFTTFGYTVTEQRFQARDIEVCNIIAEIRPVNAPEEIIVVGAHYDSVAGMPGANDNASGVAALLELARMMKKSPPPRKRIRFVAFVNEEPPFFLTEKMGSFVHAREARDNGEKITAMYALETVGYYSDAEKSQHYPPVFSLFYPDKGNFIGFIGNLRSRHLVRQSINTFRKTTSFPSEGVATFGWIPGIFWSDHWSFWKHGYPAIMITDTAPFRYQFYHTDKDTPDKLDYERMARVVNGLFPVIRKAAE